MRNLRKLMKNISKTTTIPTSIGWCFGDTISVMFKNGDIIEHNPYLEETYYDDDYDI